MDGIASPRLHHPSHTSAQVTLWQSIMVSVKEKKCHEDSVRAITMSPTDMKFATASDDGLRTHLTHMQTLIGLLLASNISNHGFRLFVGHPRLMKNFVKPPHGTQTYGNAVHAVRARRSSFSR